MPLEVVGDELFDIGVMLVLEHNILVNINVEIMSDSFKEDVIVVVFVLFSCSL